MLGLAGQAPGLAGAEKVINPVPPGRIGVRGAVAGNSTYGLGYSTAVVAGYQPTSLDRRLSLGAEWSVMWSEFNESDASLTGTLRFLEVQAGPRLRIRPDLRKQRFAVVGAGIAVLRSNAPVGPDEKRSYIGPYVCVGYEPKVGKMSLSIELRYGLAALGPPATTTVGVTVTMGR